MVGCVALALVAVYAAAGVVLYAALVASVAIPVLVAAAVRSAFR